jgi:hypothetical protein
MKRFSIVICLAIFTVAAFAQKAENETELFNKISKLTQTKKADDQEKAFQMSKEYLAKFGKADNEKTKKIKAFVENYQIFALNKKVDEDKTADAFALGKDILSSEPDNSYVTMNLAYAGYQALNKKKDKSFAQESIQFANQTLKLFGENKLPKSFDPFKNQDEATALMYYIVGNFSMESDLKATAQNFYKALQYESQIKKNSHPYYIIAFYFEKEYEKAAKDFTAKHGTKTVEDAELKADKAKLEKLIRRIQDAYARAIKYGEAENNASLADWKKRYNDVYKYLNGSDAGANDFLNNVLNTPLADPTVL